MSQLIVRFYSGLDTLAELAKDMKQEESSEFPDPDCAGAEVLGRACKQYVEALSQHDFESCMLLIFLTGCGNYGDDLIADTNKMLERQSKLRGKPVGRMYREGKKVLMNFDAGTLFRSERQSRCPTTSVNAGEASRPPSKSAA